MPIAKVQLPDGRIGRFEVPEGTKPEEIEAFVATQFKPQAPEESPSTLGKIADFFTGNNRTEFEDLPEITAAKGLPWSTAGGMLASSTPEQQKDILGQQGATFEQDAYGNDIVVLPQGKFYLNKPGASFQDFAAPVAQGLAFLTAARGGAAPFKSLPGRAAGVGAASAGGSVGLDVLAQMAGSKQGVDLSRAGVTGAMGGSFELMAPPVSAMWRFLTRGGKTPTVVEAKQALANLGIPETELTDDAVAQFIKTAADSADPAAAARAAEAASLPVPVPQTRGKLTMTSRDQMFEDLAAKGAYGDVSAKAMKQAEDEAQEALRANIPAIQSKISGGAAQVAERGQGATSVQSKLAAQNAAKGAEVDAAYDAAREVTTQIPTKTAQTFAGDIRASVKDYLPSAKIASRKLEELTGMMKAAAEKTGHHGAKPKPGLVDQFGRELAPPPPSAVDTAKIFQWRREVTGLSSKVGDPTERAALSIMVKQLDDSIESAVKSNLLAGAETEAKAWLKAIGLRREQGRIFGADDLVSDLIETEGRRLKVAPEAAGNYIFGASNTGVISKPELARELRKVKSIIGEGPEWNALREEAFLRFASQGEGAMVGGKRAFSGGNFKKSWDDAMGKNPEVMRTLFTGDEIKLINQFAAVAARTTNPVKGGANSSNTTPALARLVQSVLGPVFNGSVRIQTLLSNAFPGVVGGLQAGRVGGRAAGVLPLRQVPGGVVGGVGAAATAAGRDDE